jgi:branched-chain amino acid transport system permease protein
MDPLLLFLIQVLNAVQYGLLLFLVAAGLTLVFGIMGVINLAHGSFYMLGAYAAFSLVGATKSLLLAVLIGVPLAVLFGLVLEAVFFRRLYDRDHLYQVLLTYGLILMIEEARSLVWGDDVHGVPVPALLDWSIPLTDTLSYPVYRLFISGVCLAMALAMALVIQKTRIGMWVRAGATNREMTQVLGIDVGRLSMAVFAAGVALAAFAGMIAAPIASVFPGMGNQILIISFVVVVIGGIGSIKGALVAALLIGFADTFGKIALPKVAGMSIYLLMAAVLLWRPSGLFGRGS